MEKFISKYEDIEYILTSFPFEISEILNKYESKEGLKTVLVLEMDSGFLNNYFFLNSVDKVKQSNEEYFFPQIHLTKSNIEEIQTLINTTWNDSIKLHLADADMLLSFRAIKVNLFYFETKTIKGFAFHSAEFNLNDPYGLVRVYFSDFLSDKKLISDLVLNNELNKHGDVNFKLL